MLFLVKLNPDILKLTINVDKATLASPLFLSPFRYDSYNGGQNSLGHLSNYINFLCFQNGVLKKHCYPF